MPNTSLNGLGLEHKYGKYLTPDEELFEGIVNSVIEYQRDRWGLPEFGTRFIDALDSNTDEARIQATQEAFIGTSRVTPNIHSITTDIRPSPIDLLPTDLQTTIQAEGEIITIP